MKLALFLMNPLPSWLPWSETIELVGWMLNSTDLCSTLISISGAPKKDVLTGARLFHTKFENLINSCTFLRAKLDFAWPQTNRLKFKVLFIHAFECFNSRLHLHFEFEYDMSSESFTKLSELFYKASIIGCQENKNTDWNLFRITRERLDSFLLRLLLWDQPFVVKIETFNDMAVLICKLLFLIL